MNSIKNNPYRILGLLAGASTREVNRQANRLQKIIAAGHEPAKNDFSFSKIGELNRKETSVTESVTKLNLDSDKIHAALFWFWDGNPITDEVAFDALKEGNINKAYQVWEKLMEGTEEYWRQSIFPGTKTSRGPVNAKNCSAFHNYFVLEMLQVEGNKQNAIVANLNFLESEYSEKFVSTIADSTHRTNSKELQIIFLNEILREIEQGTISLTLSKFISILSSISFSAKNDFLKNVSQKFVSKIAEKVESARRQRTANNADAATIGENLYKQVKDDLKQLKTIVGTNDFAYSNIADKVANEIMQCLIDFFNHSDKIKSTNDYYNIAKKIARLADGIAVGNLVKEKIKDNIKTLEDMQFSAVQALKAVKQAYDNLGWNQTINESVVVDIIQKHITQQDVNMIKNSDNQSKKDEYKTLVNFLFANLSNYYKNRVNYLAYWNINNFSSPSRDSTKITPSESPQCNPSTPKNFSTEKSWIEENPGCFIAIIIGVIIFLITIFSN